MSQSSDKVATGPSVEGFCSFCVDMIKHMATDGCYSIYRKFFSPHKPIYGKSTSFHESPAYCRLCNFISNYSLNDKNNAVPQSEQDFDSITIHYDRTMEASEFQRPSRLIIQFEHPFHRVQLIVWADEGSPAAETVVTRTPILVDHAKPISQLVNDWMHECISNHENCVNSKVRKEIIKDNEADLPTRLLEVSGVADALSVRLVETQGQKGRYCALSHCWGPPELKPLETTRENIDHHHCEISFEKLPNTFKDAVRLVQGIGLRYIWIDSLCIIQNDREDWEREAKVMGSLYERAVLVIAAAGSHNSTEGLFITKRGSPATLKVPYIRDGSLKGTFNVAHSASGTISPGEGPLRDRAWAFQEWYLARRAVFFMPGGITWFCQQVTLDENYCHQDLRIYHDGSWIRFLNEYSGKSLTNPGDRIKAIEGIANEIQKTRNDKFLLQYGVWENLLKYQLLWRIVDPESATGREGKLDLPSWCWASTGLRKLWLPYNHDEDALEEVDCTISTTESGSLSISGVLIKPKYGESQISNCCIARLKAHFEYAVFVFEEQMLPDYVDRHPAYQLLHPLLSNTVLGYAVFDGDIMPNVFCLVLGSTLRESGDPMRLSFSPKMPELDVSSSDISDSDIREHEECDAFTDKSEQNLVHTNPDVHSPFEEHRDLENHASEQESDMSDSEEMDLYSTSSGSLYGCSPNCIDLFEAGRSDRVYWALLLQPLEDATAKFKRVGVALLYPLAMDIPTEELTEFEIV